MYQNWEELLGKKILLRLNVCINEGLGLGCFKRHKLPFREIILYC